MTLTCEICGSTIKTSPNAVEIDGAVLRVCQSCAKLGRPVSLAPALHRNMPTRHTSGMSFEPELEIDPEYTLIVRHAREKMGLTQEALGRMINVKTSVIGHIETGTMKPDMILARTLMHQLKVNLLVPSSELDANAKK